MRFLHLLQHILIFISGRGTVRPLQLTQKRVKAKMVWGILGYGICQTGRGTGLGGKTSRKDPKADQAGWQVADTETGAAKQRSQATGEANLHTAENMDSNNMLQHQQHATKAATMASAGQLLTCICKGLSQVARLTINLERPSLNSRWEPAKMQMTNNRNRNTNNIST